MTVHGVFSTLKKAREFRDELKYKDSIFYVDYDGMYIDNIKFQRNVMEELLDEVVGSYDSLKVNYLQENQW